jgi:hypothetical protein
MAASIYVTSTQAIKALSGFHSRLEQVRACLSLLTSLEDAFNLHLVIGSLAPEAQQQVNASLGCLCNFSPANPTASYVLNLSQTVEYILAKRLLVCWANEIRLGLCKPAELQVRRFQHPMRYYLILHLASEAEIL